MAVTYDLLAQSSFTGTTSSVSFNNINQTYTDLIILSNLTSSGSSNVNLRFNGSTSSYNLLMTSGVGSSPFFGLYNSLNSINGIVYTGSNMNGVSVGNLIHIFSYANTNVWKSGMSHYSASGESTQVGFTWASTNAISSIEYYTGSTAWSSGGFVSLYGIRAA